MGNDVSSRTTRTLIPLDDSVCWQLSNGVNERSEPISFFVSKQPFSVECRRSIQFLKTIRHPNIIKFLNDFKTFVNHDSFIADCVYPLGDKLNNNDIDLTAKLSLGIYQLTQALEFLHEKASISHNNLCLLSLYISINGIWKLGNFECACRYDNLNKKYLSSLKLIRAEECITPEEDEKNSTEIEKQEIYAIDIYAFGTLIHNLMNIINVDGSLKSLLNDLQECLTNEDPQLRPTWSMLLKTQLFQIDYIKTTELLDRLPTVHESDLPNVVDSLSTYLDNLDAEYFNELLIRRLFVPFMFLCSSTRSKLIPRILIPKDENTNNNSFISIDKYRQFVIPVLIDLYSYHVTCIRETLLEYFNSYWELIDRTSLIEIILPQLVYGLKDSNNRICMLTLIALAAMVPILGADVVVGGQRKQIFTNTIKKENVAFPKTTKTVSTTNSPVPTPPALPKTKKISSLVTNKTKPLRVKPTVSNKTTSNSNEPSSLPPPLPAAISSQYTNGQYSLPNDSVDKSQTTVVQNGLSDHNIEDEIDNDDGQWSDWENDPDPPEPLIDVPQTLPSPPPPSTIKTIREESVLPKSTSAPIKSLKLNNISKSKWNPDAPLGSEYEIPPVVLQKKKSTTVETLENQDVDDFFKDMTPKVETVELMRQLETMFHINSDQPNEQIKSTITRTTTAASSTLTNKFGIMAQVNDDNQEIESGNNNWDE